MQLEIGMLQIAPRLGLLISPVRVHLSLSRHSQPRALHPFMSCLQHSSPGVRAQQSSPEAVAPSSPEKANATLDSELQIETVAASQQRPNVQPLLYSQTRAAKWSAAKTFRRAPNPDRPWYQGYVIAFSYAHQLTSFVDHRVTLAWLCYTMQYWNTVMCLGSPVSWSTCSCARRTISTRSCGSLSGSASRISSSRLCDALWQRRGRMERALSRSWGASSNCLNSTRGLIHQLIRAELA